MVLPKIGENVLNVVTFWRYSIVEKNTVSIK